MKSYEKKAKVVTGISVGMITGVTVATLTYLVADYCMVKSTFKDLLEKNSKSTTIINRSALFIIR